MAIMGASERRFVRGTSIGHWVTKGQFWREYQKSLKEEQN